jgi:hypothetical protein
MFGSDGFKKNILQIVKICTQTLGDILNALQSYETNSDDISVICEACLRTVIKSVANRRKDDENIQVIISVGFSVIPNSIGPSVLVLY